MIRQNLFIGFIIFLNYHYSIAATIEIPRDAETFKQALEIAGDGDEVLIKSATVEWIDGVRNYGSFYIEDASGITLENKTVTVRGANPEKKSELDTQGSYNLSHTNRAMLRLINANLTFDNILIKQPAILHLRSPSLSEGGVFMVDENSTLTLEKCDFTCGIENQGVLNIKNSTLSGYSYVSSFPYFYYTSPLIPTILLGPAENAECNIINSTITSDTDRAYRCIVAEEFNNSTIIIRSAKILGGNVYVESRATAGSGNNGSPALEINECKNLNLDFHNSHFYGGDGFGPYINYQGIIDEGGDGAASIAITNSNINFNIQKTGSSLMYNLMQGGNGGDGLVNYRAVYSDIVIRDAGKGGAGLKIRNSSLNITDGTFEEIMLLSGRGGTEVLFKNHYAKPGKNGVPIDIDNASIINAPASLDSWIEF